MAGNYRRTSGDTSSAEGPTVAFGSQNSTLVTRIVSTLKRERDFESYRGICSCAGGTNSLYSFPKIAAHNGTSLIRSVFVYVKEIAIFYNEPRLFGARFYYLILFIETILCTKLNNNQIEATIHIPVRLFLYFSSHLASDLLFSV